MGSAGDVLHSRVSIHRIRTAGFPISFTHCRCGALSVTMYTSPLIAHVDQLRCPGALGCIWYACFMPAGIAGSGWCIRRRILDLEFIYIFDVLSILD